MPLLEYFSSFNSSLYRLCSGFKLNQMFVQALFVFLFIKIYSRIEYESTGPSYEIVRQTHTWGC